MSALHYAISTTDARREPAFEFGKRAAADVAPAGLLLPTACGKGAAGHGCAALDHATSFKLHSMLIMIQLLS